MRTLALSLVLACISSALSLVAQPVDSAAPPTVATVAAKSTAPLQAAASAEVLPLISFAAEFSLGDAITNLAQQAGITYAVAPELQGTNSSLQLLRQPVG